MTNRPLPSPGDQPTPTLRAALCVAVQPLLGGCTAVPVWKQERVSKPNMVFQDGGPFVYGPRLHAQLEPGSADSGGAVAAGCTACR